MPAPLFHLVRKLGKTACIVAATAVMSFFLVKASPIDPVDAYMGVRILSASPAQRQEIERRWGLDKPPLVQFARWAENLLSGDFGTSTIFNEPVLSVIGKRFLTSLWLMGAAWTASGVLGFFLGVWAGLRENSLADRIIRLYAYVLASSPTFWIGLVLLSIFSLGLGLTPFCCAAPPGVGLENATFWQRVHHVLLPALTLSIVGVAQIVLHTREKTIEILRSDYALFARAMGDSRAGFVFNQGLRNLLLPAVTLQFASLGELFGGSVLAEQVFSYPGLGRATVEAGLRGDVPLLLGVVICSALFVCAGNLIADLLYLAVDPRMRTKEEAA